MKVLYISPIGQSTPMLFDTMIGMDAVNDCNSCDVVFFDLHSRKYEYDTQVLQSVIDSDKPVVIFDFYDYGIYKNEESEWLCKDDYAPLKRNDSQWAVFIRFLIIKKGKIIWFVRKYDRQENYEGQRVYPIELIMYPDHIFPTTTRENLFNRPNDIFFAGNESPTRRKTYEGLKNKGFKIDWHWTNEKGKLPHKEWINRARQSKMFLESCGAGFGSERPYQLIYIAPMLRQKNNQLILHNLRDGLECIEVSENPTTQEIEILKDILDNKDLLYETYLNGISRMNKYFNEQYRSKYILNTLSKEGVC